MSLKCININSNFVFKIIASRTPPPPPPPSRYSTYWRGDWAAWLAGVGAGGGVVDYSAPNHSSPAPLGQHDLADPDSADRVFSGLLDPDPDPLMRGMDPDPSIIKPK